MEVALYHPECGYYTSDAERFGLGGDFYTAEQIQPVFGIVMAARMRALRNAMGSPENFRLVELGAGRGDMAEALSEFNYLPVDIGWGTMPEQFTGIVFANEFFDALPVDAALRRGSEFRQLLINANASGFYWEQGGPVQGEAAEYLDRYGMPAAEGDQREICLEALRWIERIAASLQSGWLMLIDYGYTLSELRRFPQGALMSYQRHAASEDVLSSAGERDITAHVCFTAIEEHALRCGFESDGLETLAATLLRAGEADQFASALTAGDAAEEFRRRLQLKTLLFGMGETFRTLLLRKNITK